MIFQRVTGVFYEVVFVTKEPTLNQEYNSRRQEKWMRGSDPFQYAINKLRAYEPINPFSWSARFGGSFHDLRHFPCVKCLESTLQQSPRSLLEASLGYHLTACSLIKSCVGECKRYESLYHELCEPLHIQIAYSELESIFSTLMSKCKFFGLSIWLRLNLLVHLMERHYYLTAIDNTHEQNATADKSLKQYLS
ncbi:hypothetical protein N7528_007537 [Penicillium herquei]|nr:hypothetical protein N7528_007537 [Penicillium herquei]